MRYVIHAFDKADGLPIREANRDDHVKYVNSQDVDLLLAGPLMNQAFDKPIGTLLVIDAENRDAAEAYAANDPYNVAGLFQRVDITEINITVNNMADLGG